MKKIAICFSFLLSVSLMASENYKFETSIVTTNTEKMEYIGDVDPIRSERPDIYVMMPRPKPTKGGYVEGKRIWFVSYKTQLEQVETEHWKKVETLVENLTSGGYKNIEVFTNSNDGFGCAKVTTTYRHELSYLETNIEKYYQYFTTASCESQITYTN